eukprot:jgi/Botrbrau1/16638/Bobra.0068s0057.1
MVQETKSPELAGAEECTFQIFSIRTYCFPGRVRVLLVKAQLAEIGNDPSWFFC